MAEEGRQGLHAANSLCPPLPLPCLHCLQLSRHCLQCRVQGRDNMPCQLSSPFQTCRQLPMPAHPAARQHPSTCMAAVAHSNVLPD